MSCSHVHAHHCALLEYTVQHRRVFTIFPLIIQTIIIAELLSTGEDGNTTHELNSYHGLLKKNECEMF